MQPRELKFENEVFNGVVRRWNLMQVIEKCLSGIWALCLYAYILKSPWIITTELSCDGSSNLTGRWRLGFRCVLDAIILRDSWLSWDCSDDEITGRVGWCGRKWEFCRTVERSCWVEWLRKDSVALLIRGSSSPLEDDEGKCSTRSWKILIIWYIFIAIVEDSIRL